MAAVSEQHTDGSLLAQFGDTRNRTLNLVKTLERDDFVVQTAPYTSPPKWHLGHVSWMYEVVMSKIDRGYEFYSEELSGYLNSYYNQFGRPHDKDKRGVVSRPTLDQIFRYFEETSRRVADFFAQGAVDRRGRDLLAMGIHHECQHQELLVYDLQHLLADRYRPAERNLPEEAPKAENRMIPVRGGIYEAGYSGQGFCYDVELPEHKVYLDSYRIGKFPVTNGEFLKFVDAGGYDDYRYWLADGWKRAKQDGWEAPMYWIRKDGQWHTRDFCGMRRINPAEPVVHVSYYEADAYCKWAGKRLPTEAEWEKAASWNEEGRIKTAYPWGDAGPAGDRCNLLESYLWRAAEAGSYPEGKSHYGCHQMVGDVWEWTSSEFVGYPGFKSGFDEYNDKWFTGQKVLRGGSFATPAISIRNSYRNFFRLDERWMLAGFRCAQDG